ncbi:MAG: class I SAM-dependent methyltransferase, partial [Clostridia bacterium]|nr:class I SAM-dependent methyltransferase [Clostridia bacterium]
MEMELQWDKKLKIQTVGRIDDHADVHHYPYEPTPYVVLERLAESGYIGRESHLLDYGCGKGRVGFYLNHTVGCRSTGIEYERAIYEAAMDNQKSYGENRGVNFDFANAETCKVGEADVFYFFN